MAGVIRPSHPAESIRENLRFSLIALPRPGKVGEKKAKDRLATRLT